ncbi:cupin domain-containing protein [Pseudonocardia sp. HH130630-07]|uniref:cupin domain-containing protein n=1 Tax=Pseudonocardia sp. HH130630-07 TaxID=1690815 RepID=UPI000814CB0B|nr:cupin domain-containing protein [Pseudonocardia sp. HH130630-07]ANY10179.1 cupin [Pseudonocardia sp. HH130630-07]
MTRPPLATALDLGPHPEGGWYRETWVSPVTVRTPYGERPTATAILYLLDVPGRWHRVRSTELWLWHSGSTADLLLAGAGDAPGPGLPARLGPAPGAAPQLEVPAGTWQRAVPHGPEPVLVSCIVSPGFDFADFEMI